MFFLSFFKHHGKKIIMNVHDAKPKTPRNHPFFSPFFLFVYEKKPMFQKSDSKLPIFIF
jgi:hypothetical protein